VSDDLRTRGEADVVSLEGVSTRLRADEPVSTVSGQLRVGSWVSTNCDPDGRCTFDGYGIDVSRTDVGASAKTGLGLGAAGVLMATIGAGVACATGTICKDSDDARVGSSVAIFAGVGLT
jgi:hypothetical protein